MNGLSRTLVCLFAFMLPVTSALAQDTVVTEVRDAVRGVTFYSVQLSEQPVDSWQLVSGEFSDRDKIRLGISALVLDEAQGVEEYIFWVRHEGRRWLSFSDPDDAVTLIVDGDRLELRPLRSPQPFVQPGALVEKLEFVMTPSVLGALLDAEEVVLVMRTATGEILKRLSDQEMDSMAQLRHRVS